MKSEKTEGNRVDGDRFFDRKAELEALMERVYDGTHTLLRAQRRMGKTSLLRELLRRLDDTGDFETVLVDLEAAEHPADAVAEIAVQARGTRDGWREVRAALAHVIQHAGRIEELPPADLRVKLRAGIDAENWTEKGDAVLAALARGERPVVLAMDELPVMINRLLREGGDRITIAGLQATDEFLGWLRRNGQTHRGQISVIASGSVGLEPVLAPAGLGEQAGILAPCDLEPWDEDTAISCLGTLADDHGIVLLRRIRRDMCRHLGCCIPHHVRMFFDGMHEHLRRDGRSVAKQEDVRHVYQHEMLSVRGQPDLQHHENWLKTILGGGYPIALEMLTCAAVIGFLGDDLVARYRAHYAAPDRHGGADSPDVDDVLHMLERDGYIERHDNGYWFVSRLMEDWWFTRYGQDFVPVFE